MRKTISLKLGEIDLLKYFSIKIILWNTNRQHLTLWSAKLKYQPNHLFYIYEVIKYIKYKCINIKHKSMSQPEEGVFLVSGHNIWK